MSSQLRDLFGGAITANLPTRIRDLSDIRDVPDAQEAFVYLDPIDKSESLLLIEVLEYRNQDDGEAVISLFFDHAEDEEAIEPRIFGTMPLDWPRHSNATGPRPIVTHDASQGSNIDNADDAGNVETAYEIDSLSPRLSELAIDQGAQERVVKSTLPGEPGYLKETDTIIDHGAVCTAHEGGTSWVVNPRSYGSAPGDSISRLKLTDNTVFQNQAMPVNTAKTVDELVKPAFILQGKQKTPMRGARATQPLDILMALFRVPTRSRDILASVSIPDSPRRRPQDFESIKADFESLVLSLCVHDFELFG